MHRLSSVQSQIWFDEMIRPGTSMYNVAGYVKINTDGEDKPEVVSVSLIFALSMVHEGDSMRTMYGLEPLPLNSRLSIIVSGWRIAREVPLVSSAVSQI